MKKRILFPFLLISAGAIFMVYSTNRNPVVKPSNDNKIKIAASFYPMYFFAGEIGKDKAQVKNITPAGVETHDYELTARNIAEIENSKMLVLNGLVEGWGEKIKNNLKGKNVKVLIAGEGLFNQKDPHLWLSPATAKKEVIKILEGFLETDPANKDYYNLNANDLITRLDYLDKEYTQGLKNCKQKDIVTSHAAFGYLASSYGLNQMAISGLSPDSEPSLRQLKEITRFAKEHKIQYIFFESLASPKLSETVAKEIGAKTLVLNPLEGLTDEEIFARKNYLSVMEENLNNLKTALQCNQ